MEDIELEEFIASWRREGLSENHIAVLTECLLRSDNRNVRADLPTEPPEDDDELWGSTVVSRERQVALAASLQIMADPDNTVDTDLLGALPDEPGATAPDQPSEQSEVQASSSNDLIILADPGNEPKQTREPPKRIIPRAGRPPIDITSPETKRMLERLRPRSLAEIAAIKPPQWLLARHIPENSLIALFGRFSTCKSFLAMAWGLSIASGKSWLGRRVQQGHVFYVSAEGNAGIVKRAAAFCKEHGLKELPEKFHTITCSVAMNDPTILDYLAIGIRQTLKDDEKPKLIVIDTLNRCFGGGDENSTKDMSAFVAGCDAMREEFGASVLIIHHTGHDSSKGSRGATSLPSAMDIAFLLVKPKGSSLAILKNEDPAKPHKDSAPLPDRALEFVEIEIDGLEPNEDDPHATTSLIVRAANAERAAEAEQAAQRKKRGPRSTVEETLAVIRSCEDGITLPDLVIKRDKPRGTIRSHLDKLLDDGRIRQEGDFFLAVGDDDEPSIADQIAKLGRRQI
jgi:putative DNA primase/helicase